ncbi:MAG: Gmad2 immunoglobulin-like domain-containing protein [Coriobacteriia bacterium]|nr:Gmad2 immunoglobulin-like domain-containing protein [Coriobacteriia bacterium]
MKPGTRVIALMCALSLLAVSGCSGGADVVPTRQPGIQETATPPAPPPESTRILAYFTRGEQVGVGARTSAASGTEALAEAAMEALLAGPTAEEREFGLGTTIPEGTRLNGVAVDDGVATVDLSPEFASGGGSLSMLLRVTQVVCTLTQFSDVDRVAFALDGEKATSIGGEGIVVDPPVDRAAFEGQLPAILIEYPAPGETVASPLTAWGSSNVFEATHQLNVTDPDGLIIVDTFVTATSGTGTRGTWSETVEFGPIKRAGLGAVIVFELSAKDGSQQNIVEIPVQMTE